MELIRTGYITTVVDDTCEFILKERISREVRFHTHVKIEKRISNKLSIRSNNPWRLQ